MSDAGSIDLAPAATAADIEAARILFVDYAGSLGFSLNFQGFNEELASLPGKYAPPSGRILLARIDGDAAGVVALRPMEAGVCEMKRLYVLPEHRGSRLGRTLAEAAIDAARAIGYCAMRLDTVASMTAATGLYLSLGFREIAPYYDNPVAGAIYFELSL